MRKIKKVFNLFFAIIFLYQSIAFCFPEGNSALRSPLYFSRPAQLEFRSGNINIEGLGKPTVIFDGDIISTIKSSTGEKFYQRDIFKKLGISLDLVLGAQLQDALSELIINSVKYRLTKRKEAVHLEVISYSHSGEGPDVKKTIRFTIKQKSSRDSDWQELIREKAGFDNRGSLDYLQNFQGRRKESINKQRTKYGLLNIAKLMQDNHPVLLKYVRSSMEPYPVVTDFYYELPADKNMLDVAETTRGSI